MESKIKKNIKGHIKILKHKKPKDTRESRQALEITELNRDWILYNLKCVLSRCMQAEPVIREGKETGQYTFNASGALKALELIGIEMFQMFQRNVNVKGEISQSIIFTGEKELKD